ncbi:MAG: iron-containing alcohol dehydrogenase [Erysipelotrichaceae bacterium]|nr:iron-containing alcohol dehydrogenase [Erysipelotrichaceae bacterium]MDY5251595.1 iron-containing alcohol dehydrogenase [Erysipelotrichaceae bacterium]
MNNFEFYAPTKIYFGKNEEEKIADIILSAGYKKILIHYGGQSAIKSGLLNKVCNLLTAKNIEYVRLGGVIANPVLSKVNEGIALCKKEKVDFILAVGGGSVIDSAKAIAVGAKEEQDVWEHFAKKTPIHDALAVGCILTIAAAGSEMSNSSVITNEDGGYKRSIKSDLIRCQFSILNPELTYTLPAYQTASGCVDIMLHTLERYFSDVSQLELKDEFAEGLLRNVVKYALLLKHDPSNYQARAEIMWASTMSHNDTTGTGGDGDWACHQLEHELSGKYGVAHGAGLAAVWGSWARYVYKTNIQRFVRYANKVWNIEKENDEATALAGIVATEEFFKQIDMPITITELLGYQLTNEEIDELAFKCSYEKTRMIGKFKKLDIEDIRLIYLNAK